MWIRVMGIPNITLNINNFEYYVILELPNILL